MQKRLLDGTLTIPVPDVDPPNVGCSHRDGPAGPPQHAADCASLRIRPTSCQPANPADENIRRNTPTAIPTNGVVARNDVRRMTLRFSPPYNIPLTFS
jgi:hypothetical protein